MNKKVNDNNDIRCINCNKYYSSKSSLCNHNKKYHNKNVNNDTILALKSNITGIDLTLKSNSLSCKYCNRKFNFRQNKYQHEKICKIKKQIEEKEKTEELYKMEEIKLKQLKEVTKQKEYELKILNKNSNNINNGSISNTTNTNSNNNTNNNTNNIIINQFGKESVNDLKMKEVKKLIDSKSNAFLKVIEMLNFNEKRPENHNFCTTSLDGKFTNVFNPKTCEIEKITKNDFFDLVFNGSIRKIDDLIFRFEFKINDDEHIDDKYLEELQNIASKADNIYSNFRKDYHEDINAISYNNRKKVLNTWKNAKPNLEVITESDDEEVIEETNKEELDEEPNVLDEYLNSSSDSDED